MIVYFKILQENSKIYIELPTKNGSVANYQVLSQYYRFSVQDYFACLRVLDNFNSNLLSYKTDFANVLQMNKEYTPFSQINLDTLIGCAKDLYLDSQSSILGFLKCDVTVDSSSEVPDYTNILTDINTNLTNLNSKFNCNINSNTNISLANLISNIFQYDNGTSSMRLNNIRSTETKNKGNLVNILSQLVNSFASQIGISDEPITISNSKKIVHLILSSLKQSVSPNASITDVISSLNSNIHNDLSNINATTENKDTILLIDGQQEFKLRNKEEMDF